MRLREILKERIVLKDGSVGAALSRTDIGKHVPFYEILNIQSPKTVSDLHLAYLDVGAEIITTNSFSSHPFSLQDWGQEDKAYEINFKAGQLAKIAVQTSGKTAWVAGSLGPTAASLTLCKGNTDFDHLKNGYKLQAKALLDGGADFLLIETIHDPLNAKAAWSGILELFEEGYNCEIALSMTVELTGLSLSGQSIKSFIVSTMHLNPLFLGLNCSLGPQSLFQPLSELSELSPFPVSLAPNAGLPDLKGAWVLTPEIFTEQLKIFLDKKHINIIGGCCGTTPEYIKLLAEMLKGREPRNHRGELKNHIAGLEAYSLFQKPAPMVVGERANTLGSRKFKKLVLEHDSEKVVEVLRKQDISGAHALDICFAATEDDELNLWKEFAPSIGGVIKPPVFIDSTRNDVVETALKFIPGKPVINSVNLEDGGKRIRHLGKLLKVNPLAVVAGLIDEHGMAKTLESKIDIATKLHAVLIENGFKLDDIILDPLVFPLSAQINPSISINAISELKKRFPESPVILGISNISFGLPPQARSILNSVYLKMALDAGLDIAIVNIDELARSGSIDEEDQRLARTILENADQDALHQLVEKYRGKKAPSLVDKLSELTPTERLKARIIEGLREGMGDDLEKLMETMDPLEIINQPLMEGMERVGVMFGKGQLIISEVLLSAEVFRNAMNYLLPMIKPDSLPKQDKIILATVKGDVHDIGRNLVGMILESHGFQVVDLGTRVSPEELIAAVKHEQPLAVGLSGLLIRSAYMMRETVEAFKEASINVPVVVGGAALTAEFTESEIEPAYPQGIVRYAKDCLDGLRIFREIASGEVSENPGSSKKISKPSKQEQKNIIYSDVEFPIVPDYEEHIVKPIPVDDLVPMINWDTLIHRYLGAHGGGYDDAREKLEKTLNRILSEDIFKPAGILKFFRAVSRNNDLSLLTSDLSEIAEIPFTRSGKGICATDWVSHSTRKLDSVAIFVVTAGDISKFSDKARLSNNFLYAYELEAFSLEFAEAAADYVHNVVRKLWGIEKNRGVRLSPGYPCCPDMEIQKLIFDLLEPSKIGVTLTEEMMMEPEDSISAVVFHHPEGRLY